MVLYVPYDEIKPIYNARGQPSVFIWQAFPWLKPLYTQFELNYDKVPDVQDAVRRAWKAPFIAIAIYAIVIFGGQRLMKNRPAFDLKAPLAAWNLLLAAFSFMGVIRTAPYLFYWLTNISYRDINCLHPSFTHGEKDVGFWVMCFIFSKFFELIDTVFIVLRKKPLIFLHWYHHITVLLYCYFSSAFHHAGLFFVAMNYSVHSIMYFYFFLMAVKMVPKWFNPLWITVAQISQMFVGVFVTASAWYYKSKEGDDCVGAKWPLLYGALAMYGSYLYLFVEFAVLRFIIAPRKRAARLAEMGKKKAEEEQQQGQGPSVGNLLKKMSSMVTGTEPGTDPAKDEGVPLLRPRITANAEASYSFHFELPGEDGETTKRGVDRKKML